METPSEIHAVSVSYHCGSDNSQRTASLTDVGFPNAALYDGAYLHLDCAERVTNFQVSVQNKAIGALDVDASTDTQRPNAGKITSNVYAPKGTSATDPNWAIVLPHNGAYGALTVAIRAYLCHHGNDFSVSEVQFYADQATPTCNGQRVCAASAATLLEDFAGAGPQDVKATWTCGNDPSPYTAVAVPWTVTRSGVSYPTPPSSRHGAQRRP